MNKNNFCVIMAGGVGSRFWPLSRTRTPKQFLDILGTGKSLLRQTFERFTKICPTENIYIVTNEIYGIQVAEQLPEIRPEQILAEPLRRNTAPCIAFSNYKIKQSNPDANIIVAPSDHLILDEEKFVKVMKESLEFTAQSNGLLTLGMNPSRPETGYGYIQVTQEKPEAFPTISKVKTFTEKPDKETAQAFLDSGEFFWNSGIFIWNLKSIDKAFEKHQPNIANAFKPQNEIETAEDELQFIEKAYAECKSISIDNGIMEHADNVYVYCTDFGWSDLGTWDSLYEHLQKDEKQNALKGENILSYDNENTLINVPDDKLVVAQGLEGYIVAESDGILLICKRNEESKLRQFVNDVKLKKGDTFV